VNRLLAVTAVASCLVLACGSPRPSRVVIGIGMTENSHGGVKLAAAEINAAGGIDGVRLELAGLAWTSPMTPYSPAAILEWAARFAKEPDLVAVIGHSDSASTLSAAPSYNRDHIPQIVTIATNTAITNIGTWTYRLCLSDGAQGPALATYAVQDWQKRRLAIFYVNDDYGRGLAQLFEERARKLGAQIVSSVLHRNALQSDDEETILGAIDKMRSQQVDLVVLFQRVDAALWTVKAIQDAGLRVDILGGDNLAQFSFARAPAGLTEGLRVSQFLNLDLGNPRVAAFVTGIRAASNQYPDYAQAYAYDAVYLLRDAVANGGYSRDGVKSYLDRLVIGGQPIHGVTGTFVLGADHDARRPLYISAIDNGGFRVLKALPVQ
jgi:branched-chain amino acid transport system substrate-binding protein